MSAGIKANADGSAAIQVGGSDAITITSGLAVSMNGGAVYPLTSGTAVASTSGTSIDFTGIPSTAKRVTVMLNTVSASSTGIIMLQLGAGSIETSGYTGSVVRMVAGGNGTALLSSGFLVSEGSVATQNFSGTFIASYIGSNLWTVTGNFGGVDSARCNIVAGVKTLTGTLDRVRITTSTGTDTFDAGSINIMWE